MSRQVKQVTIKLPFKRMSDTNATLGALTESKIVPSASEPASIEASGLLVKELPGVGINHVIGCFFGEGDNDSAFNVVVGGIRKLYKDSDVVEGYVWCPLMMMENCTLNSSLNGDASWSSLGNSEYLCDAMTPDDDLSWVGAKEYTSGAGQGAAFFQLDVLGFEYLWAWFSDPTSGSAATKGNMLVSAI